MRLKVCSKVCATRRDLIYTNIHTIASTEQMCVLAFLQTFVDDVIRSDADCHPVCECKCEFVYLLNAPLAHSLEYRYCELFPECEAWESYRHQLVRKTSAECINAPTHAHTLKNSHVRVHEYIMGYITLTGFTRQWTELVRCTTHCRCSRTGCRPATHFQSVRPHGSCTQFKCLYAVGDTLFECRTLLRKMKQHTCMKYQLVQHTNTHHIHHTIGTCVTLWTCVVCAVIVSMPIVRVELVDRYVYGTHRDLVNDRLLCSFVFIERVSVAHHWRCVLCCVAVCLSPNVARRST